MNPPVVNDVPEVLFVCVQHAGQPVEVVRRIRDDIDARVKQLLAELVPGGT